MNSHNKNFNTILFYVEVLVEELVFCCKKFFDVYLHAVENFRFQFMRIKSEILYILICQIVKSIVISIV